MSQDLERLPPVEKQPKAFETLVEAGVQVKLRRTLKILAELGNYQAQHQDGVVVAEALFTKGERGYFKSEDISR